MLLLLNLYLISLNKENIQYLQWHECISWQMPNFFKEQVSRIAVQLLNLLIVFALSIKIFVKFHLKYNPLLHYLGIISGSKQNWVGKLTIEVYKILILVLYKAHIIW